VKDDRYIEGLLPWGDRQIHISRGVGALYGLRINCPPEVTVLEIT
jgi:predicted MPP superfamily phosphohydrolase